jgi:hypothetical protein
MPHQTEEKPLAERDSGAVPLLATDIRIPAPTQEQMQYLNELRADAGKFDPKVVVGGPRRS